MVEILTFLTLPEYLEDTTEAIRSGKNDGQKDNNPQNTTQKTKH
jgi:hypothetical protein